MDVLRQTDIVQKSLKLTATATGIILNISATFSAHDSPIQWLTRKKKQHRSKFIH